MDQKAIIVESLLERAAEYGKTSFELTKLRLLDKATELISTLLPYFVTALLILFFLLMISIATSYWISEWIGNIFIGFFIVAAFYLVMAFVFHFLFSKKMRNGVSNFMLKKFFK